MDLFCTFSTLFIDPRPSRIFVVPEPKRRLTLLVSPGTNFAESSATLDRALLLILTWHSATTTRHLSGSSEPIRSSRTFCNSSKCILSLIPCARILVLLTSSTASISISRDNKSLGTPLLLICPHQQRRPAAGIEERAAAPERGTLFT